MPRKKKNNKSRYISSKRYKFQKINFDKPFSRSREFLNHNFEKHNMYYILTSTLSENFLGPTSKYTLET